MRDIRVLIIDRDVIVRQKLVFLLKDEPGIEIIGVTAGGSLSSVIADLHPSIILLGLDEDGIAGIHTMGELQVLFPEVPIVVLIPRNQDGGRIAMKALEKGAVEFITKPDRVESILFAGDHLRKRLLPIIEVGSRSRRKSAAADSTPEKDRSPILLSGAAEDTRRMGVDAVVISACTGGPIALSEFVSLLPRDFPVPILIAQHMPRYFTSALADWLNRRSEIRVVEGRSGDQLEAGVAMVARGGHHMAVHHVGNRIQILTHRGPRNHECRPSIDVLFRSAAECFGRRVLAVVLSGTGTDGIRGCKAIRAAGGRILVQDEASALAWELPGSVVRARLADDVLSVGELADEVIKRVMIGRGTRRHQPKSADESIRPSIPNRTTQPAP